MAQVTSKNFAERLLRSAEQAAAIKEGRRKPARVSRYKLTARKAGVAPPPAYTPARIITVRKKLGVSQPLFAGMLNVSPSTVRAWEQGIREPEGATRRLLEIAERVPEALTGAVAPKQ